MNYLINYINEELLIQEAIRITADTKPHHEEQPEKERKIKQVSSKNPAWKLAYGKMHNWHNGKRKQNLKNCSDDKLIINYNVCASLKYDKEMKEIEAEADRRGLELFE